MTCVETRIAELIADINAVVDCYNLRGCNIPHVPTQHGCVADVVQAIEETVQTITACEYYTGSYIFNTNDFSGCLENVIAHIGNLGGVFGLLECVTTCNDCDPPIPDILIGRLVMGWGNGTPIEEINGSHILRWQSPCIWGPWYILGEWSLAVNWSGSTWQAYLMRYSISWYEFGVWQGGSDPCNPTGTYALIGGICNDPGWRGSRTFAVSYT